MIEAIRFCIVVRPKVLHCSLLSKPFPSSTKEELYSRPIFSFMHPDDREMTAREREKLLMGKAMLNFQNRYITRGGEIVWLEWTSIYLPDTNPQ